MKIQQPTSGIARLTVVLAGSRRRKAAVMVGLMVIGAALFDSVGVEDTSVALSPDVSGEDEFQQIEMMLAELEQEAISGSAISDPVAMSQQSPVNVSNRSTTTSLVIPGSTDDSPLTTNSHPAVAVSATPPPTVPTYGVSYRNSPSDPASRATRPNHNRIEPGSRSRATPPAIHLTGTIDPL